MVVVACHGDCDDLHVSLSHGVDDTKRQGGEIGNHRQGAPLDRGTEEVNSRQKEASAPMPERKILSPWVL